MCKCNPTANELSRNVIFVMYVATNVCGPLGMNLNFQLVLHIAVGH